ncbi:Coiled-coil domain-containing protein 90-like [Microdochium nivale]|nr:Coiled-coil domain-containing protein 90-like [Microdochium nivale]
MSTTRLTFLYPALFRTAGARARDGAPRAFQQANKHHTPAGPALRMASTFSTSTASRKAAFPRHGSAVEPVDTTSPSGGEAQPVPQPTTETKAKVKPESAPTTVPISDETTAKDKPQGVAKDPVPAKTGADEKPGLGPVTINAAAAAAAAGAAAGKTPQQAAADAKIKQGGPMEAVLHMPPPDMVSHPHITPSPYVHHFDTYTLVKQLETDGYTKEQATTAMKAIRRLLAHHLEVAQEGLVSKSDVDNETYLFNAACSELSTEVKNNRKVADETIRQQRTHLQHEVDILSQRMTQDILTLKDEVRAAFHDRKMTVREEQRSTESLLQSINMEISTQLSGDAKSDIEGLRWILSRRSVLGIVFMAIMTLATLRYGSYVNHERQRVVDERKRRDEELKRNGGREDYAPPVDAAQILAAN